MPTDLAGASGYPGRMSEPLYIPAPLGGTNDRMLAAFADALRGQVIEGFRLYDVQVATEWWPETDTFVKVTVLVDDPPAGSAGWPAEQRLALSMAIDRLTSQFGIAEPTSVRTIYLRSAIEAGIPAETVARAREEARRHADQPPDPGA
jgi:hypothetical protein